MDLQKVILFGIFSLILIVFSRRVLADVKSHGFYRFLSWECMLWLFCSNYRDWFRDPLSINQVFSWLLLLISACLALAGFVQIIKSGKSDMKRKDDTLFDFEKTTELVETGIYKYIRHPLYSSLLFLTWGIYMKGTGLILLFTATGSSIFLFITALLEEKECARYFGEKYINYMKRSKRFIPFII